MIKKYSEIENLVQTEYIFGKPVKDLKLNYVQDLPILIDFKKSICNISDFYNNTGESVITRKKYRNIWGLNLLKKMVSPIPKVTKNNFKELECKLFKISSKPVLLIVGGGTLGRGTERIYNNQNIDIISFDVYSSENISFIADAHQIPLKDNCVDGVIIQYVLEHVVEPHTVTNEIFRVLRSGGIVYSETPFLEQVHEAAYDFSRFTLSGHRYLFKGFEEISAGIVCGAGTHLMWTFEYLFRGLFRSKLIGKLFKLAFFWLQYLDIFMSEGYNIDMADSFYFLGKKKQENRFSVNELPSYYKGADNK